MLPKSETVKKFTLVGEDEFSPEQHDLNTLANLISRFAPCDGSFDLPVPGIHVVRGSEQQAEAVLTLSEPGICIVAQGAKCVSLAQNTFQYDPSRLVVYAAEVPIRVRFAQATPEKPYLCLVIRLEPKRLAELILKVYPNGLKPNPEASAIYLGDSNPKVVKTSIRILEMILQQEDADLLVPLAVDEILIRLLRSPVGPAIAQIGLSDSHAHKISKAITWLKNNYAQPIKVEELAKIANMSASSFHGHFKSITAMSPLQFQKNLRLQEARRLMITHMKDVSSACNEVGYVSVSQFSREYRRLFGYSPSQDAERFRD